MYTFIEIKENLVRIQKPHGHVFLWDIQELTLLINMHIRLEEEEEDDGDLSKYDLWGSADADADDNQGIYNIHSFLQ